MSIGVSHNLDTGKVVLLDQAARKIYDFEPVRARALASDLRAAAFAGGAVLIVATADDGQQVRIGGEADRARAMADDLDRNADLGRGV
jgi:hypothetical protein